GIGFDLTTVDFGLLMVSTGGVTPINYMALKVDVVSASLVGINGLTAVVNDLSVEVNKTSDLVATNTVLDFVDTDDGTNSQDVGAASWLISTGPATPDVTLDMDGDEGVLLSIETDIELDVFGFVQLDGSFAFKKATGSFVLTDADTNTSDTVTLSNASYLTVGARIASGFVYFNMLLNLQVCTPQRWEAGTGCGQYVSIKS
ncbi:MAG: hypothetical protein AB1Z31_12640, partial [Desulfobacterales bacterium]